VLLLVTLFGGLGFVVSPLFWILLLVVMLFTGGGYYSRGRW
jgi:hypothetical protein